MLLTTGVVRIGDNYLYVFKGTPCGRARRPASARALSVSADHRRGGSEGTRPAAGAGEEGGTRRWHAAAWPAASSAAAHRHGRLPPTRSAPHSPTGGPHRHAPPVTTPARANRAALPREAILSPRKLPVKGAPGGASLRFAPGRPLTASFPGKSGTYREDGGKAGRP